MGEGRWQPAALDGLELGELADYVVRQRWFGAKAREVAQLGILDAVALASEPRPLLAALIETRFGPGTHETYHLPLVLGSGKGPGAPSPIAHADGSPVYDALADADAARRLLELMQAEATAVAEDAKVAFSWTPGFPAPPEGAEVRAMGSEQSNTSVVFGERLVLKSYRRVEAGINPELELLRFLTAREFPHVAPLAGWYEYSGRLVDATLGIAQEFLPGARDGWELALDDLSSEPDAFAERARELGAVTAALHSALASDPTDPAFAPEETSPESLALLTATVDEEIERIFLELPEDEGVQPILGRAEEVRDRLRMLTSIGEAGQAIRAHGDYHLGQVLLTHRGWTVIDFEGEPARSVPERRRKRSPLRDVAGMLRSFAYAASASEILRDGPAATPDWEAAVRDAFLQGYLERVSPALLPSTREGVEQLLRVFELEKAVYELHYELNNRPGWLRIPVAGIARLLEVPAG